jgi:hypothetical protein
MHKILVYLHIIHLLKSSTCFEHYSAHLPKVYVVIVYMQTLVSPLSAGDCLVHRLRRNKNFVHPVRDQTKFLQGSYLQQLRELRLIGRTSIRGAPDPHSSDKHRNHWSTKWSVPVTTAMLVCIKEIWISLRRLKFPESLLLVCKCSCNVRSE